MSAVIPVTPDAALLVAVTLLEHCLPNLRGELYCDVEVNCELTIDMAGDFSPRLDTLDPSRVADITQQIVLIRSVQQFVGFEVDNTDRSWLDDLIDEGLPQAPVSAWEVLP